MSPPLFTAALGTNAVNINFHPVKFSSDSQEMESMCAVGSAEYSEGTLKTIGGGPKASKSSYLD